MSGWASPAVNSWTSDPQLRFRFCFVDDLTYVPKQSTSMPAPPPRPTSVPQRPTPYEPSDHLRYLVSSPRTTRVEVERRLHLLKMSLKSTKGEQRKQALGDIAFLQCVLEKFGSGFASASTSPSSSFSGSPPKSPKLKAFILHRHKDKAEKLNGTATPERAGTPEPLEPRDVSCCSAQHV